MVVSQGKWDSRVWPATASWLWDSEPWQEIPGGRGGVLFSQGLLAQDLKGTAGLAWAVAWFSWGCWMRGFLASPVAGHFCGQPHQAQDLQQKD